MDALTAQQQSVELALAGETLIKDIWSSLCEFFNSWRDLIAAESTTLSASQTTPSPRERRDVDSLKVDVKNKHALFVKQTRDLQDIVRKIATLNVLFFFFSLLLPVLPFSNSVANNNN